MQTFLYNFLCVFVCVGGGHRCSPHTGALCSLALALIGRPHHGGSVGASVRLHSQFHHRSVRVCVFRHGACPWGLSHMHSGLRAALSPLVTTEQHCVSLSPTSARLSASYNRHTLMATGSRPVGDDVWKIEHLCWLPLFLGQIQRF